MPAAEDLSCPDCDLPALRRSSALGLGRKDPRRRSWMFGQAPAVMGLTLIGVAGWGLIVFAALMMGLEDPRKVLALFLAGVAGSVFQALRLSQRSAPASTPEKPRGGSDLLCLHCRPHLYPDGGARPFPFEKLRVGHRADILQPPHLRPLIILEALAAAGSLAAPAVCLAAGCGLLGAAAWIHWRHWTGLPLWGMSGGGLPFFELLFLYSAGVMAGGMGLAFLRLWRAPALLLHRLRPDDFALASGQVRWKDPRGGGLEIAFNDPEGREVILLESYRDVNRYFVLAGEEKALGPEDEWHEPAGKRLRLPVAAWVLHEKTDPWNASLVGLSAPDQG